MATPLYLYYVNATATRGRNDLRFSGVAGVWVSYRCTPTLGVGPANQLSMTTETNPANPLDFPSGGSAFIEWLSEPLAADQTISGTITFNVYAYESNMSANATVGIRIERVNNVGAIISTIVHSSFLTELGTSVALKTWTASPTSTNMLRGERFRIRVFCESANGVTMAGGYTVFLQIGGDASSSYATGISFTETFSFESPVFQNFAYAYTSSRHGLTYGNGKWVWVGGSSGVPTAAYGYGAGADGPAGGKLDGPTTDTQYGCCYGGSLFVSVGLNGGIWTSSDGVTWTDRAGADNATTMNDVCYGSSLYVAVGASGTIWTSTTGTSGWTNQTTPSSTNNCRAIAYDAGNGVYVVVGNGGLIWTSSNGTSWTAQTSGTSQNLTGVAYGNGHWVACGNGPTILHSSNNGVTWDTRTAPSSSAYTVLLRVIYANSAFVLTSNAAAMLVYSDNTATTFSAFPLPVDNYSDSINAIAYNGDLDLIGMTAQTGYSFKVIKPTVLLTTGRILYATDTASDIADRGTVEKKIWTTRGTG